MRALERPTDSTACKRQPGMTDAEVKRFNQPTAFCELRGGMPEWTRLVCGKLGLFRDAWGRHTGAVSRKALVTGGAGFIGSHLVGRLLARGDSVAVIDDLSTGSEDNLAGVLGNPRLTLIRGKVSEQENLEELAGTADLVFHLAAAVGVELVIHSPIRTMETNLKETEAILEAAAAGTARILVASTSEVYGKSTKEEFSEEDDLLIGPPTLGRWSYACSKLMDEFLALGFRRERGAAVTVARLFNTVGPRQTGRYGMVLPRFVAAAKAGAPLRVYGDGRQTRCFCHVTDTVEAMLRLMDSEAAIGEVVNVGRNEPVSVSALARLVLEMTGSGSAIEFVPYEDAYAPGFEDMRARRPKLAKLEALTGFRAQRNLREIVGELCEKGV
jgi:UDP-glucose 4-epimerase